MQKIHGSDFLVEDPVVNEYLHELSIKFSRASKTPNLTLDFFGVNSPELNAFAFFGDHVAVHSGLILAVGNENELAAVLAHETAHITQQHLSRMLTASDKMMPLTFAELLAAAAIGALGAPEAGMHLATAAMANHLQQMINYTREHEQEADRIGMQLLARAKFDPKAMASVFQRMKQQARYEETAADYLLTHPVFDARIADAQNRADQIPYQPTTDSIAFGLIRARLEVEKPENASKKLKRLKENVASSEAHPKLYAQYAYALALLKNDRATEALPLLQAINLQVPHQWILALSLAEAEYATGQTVIAIHRAQQWLSLHPNNYALILQNAHFLLRDKQGKACIKLLQLHRKEHVNDPTIHQLLARAYQMTQQPVQLHRSQAEWRFTKGEFKAAYQQLDLALEYAAHNKVFIPLIQARKAEIEAIQKQQRELRL